MRIKSMLVAAATALTMSTGLAVAAPPDYPDPDGYYSRTDHDGYYDRDGRYRHFDRGYRGDRYGDDRGPGYGPPPPGNYYREGYYERDCRRGNAAAGTIFGAIGGGLIGGAASHGNAGAVAGGVILGGLLGNAISRDVDCDDQRAAFNVYADGLNGDIGRRYEWRHGASYGTFTPTREYYDGGQRCRAFTTVTYRGGQTYTRDGVACYDRDSYWHFR